MVGPGPGPGAAVWVGSFFAEMKNKTVRYAKQTNYQVILDQHHDK